MSETKHRRQEEDVMKVRSRLALLVAALVVTSATAWANITTDYDRKVDFAHYKTYSWGNVKTPDSLWDARVKQAVDGQLAAKGWTQVPSGGDVVVTARDAIHNQEQLNTFYNGFGGGRRFGGGIGMSTTSVDTYKVGTLIVDVIDGQTKNLIWRSAASDTLASKPDKNIKILDKNVQKMFAHFPPSPSHS
jgi:Domain of unknown function (DUF4136)